MSLPQASVLSQGDLFLSLASLQVASSEVQWIHPPRAFRDPGNSLLGPAAIFLNYVLVYFRKIHLTSHRWTYRGCCCLGNVKPGDCPQEPSRPTLKRCGAWGSVFFKVGRAALGGFCQNRAPAAPSPFMWPLPPSKSDAD